MFLDMPSWRKLSSVKHIKINYQDFSHKALGKFEVTICCRQAIEKNDVPSPLFTAASPIPQGLPQLIRCSLQ